MSFDQTDRAVAFDRDLAGNGLEARINDQFRTERAGANLRAGEIEIIFLLERVVGELIADAHADAARLSVADR